MLVRGGIMRTIVAIMVAAGMAAGAAQAGEVRSSWLTRIQAVAAEDGGAESKPPTAAPRPPVAQAPITPPQSAHPPAAPLPPVAEIPPETQEPATPPPNATPTPRPPILAVDAPVFTMTGEHVAAIGVGVVGGMVILDGVLGVPMAAAAFVGGLAGQLWHTTYQAPVAEARINHRTTGHIWQEAVARDGAAKKRWLQTVRADGHEG